MHDDIALDSDFRALGLDWWVPVERVIIASLQRGPEDDPALRAARGRALDFALALGREEPLFETDAFGVVVRNGRPVPRATAAPEHVPGRPEFVGDLAFDEEDFWVEDLLIDDPDVDPPEAWETARTRAGATAGMSLPDAVVGLLLGLVAALVWATVIVPFAVGLLR